jgi:formylglycine-generating enzyme required for sulfatase activity
MSLANPPSTRALAPGPAETPLWVSIPPGRFWMGCVPDDRNCHGNEGPRHCVSITRPFSLMATELTVAHLESVVQRGGWRSPRQPFWSSPDRPAVNITWGEAESVCHELGGRLPTEAEWEYAARGGKEAQVFPWGNEFSRGFVNASGRSGGDQWPYTAPPQAFPPNRFKLYHVSGNVWEWTADWYTPSYSAEPQRDPKGAPTGTRRVIRGGSWDSTAPRLRTSVRHGLPPEGRYNLFLGVRCARDVR